MSPKAPNTAPPEPDDRGASLQWPAPVSDDDIMWLGPGETPSVQAAARDSAEAVAHSPAPPAVSSAAPPARRSVASQAAQAEGKPVAKFVEPPAAQSAAPSIAHSDAPPVAPGVTQSAADVEAPRPLEGLALSRLIASGVAFEWHDAVAIVQAAAHSVAPDRNAPPLGGIASVDGIVLRPDGAVDAIDRSSHEAVVPALGRLLQKLLQDKPVPANLRLLAWQASSDSAASLSLEQFAAELDRWERPGRAKKLVDLFERGQSAPAPADAPPPPEAVAVVAPDPPAPVKAAPERETESKQPATRKRPAWIAGAAATGLGCACAGAAFAWFIGVGGREPIVAARLVPDDRDIELAVEDASPPPKTPLVAERAERSNRRLPPASSSSGSAASARVSAPVAATRAFAGAAGAPPVSEPAAFPRLQLEALRPPTPAPNDAAPLFERRAPAARLEPSIPARPGTLPLFHTGDAGVTDPVLVKPYLPELRTNVPESELGVLEIVVDTRGGVESVRLKSPENRYREKWWLFTAKGWRFEPAMRDGKPVRFLKRVLLTDLNMTEPQ